MKKNSLFFKSNSLNDLMKANILHDIFSERILNNIDLQKDDLSLGNIISIKEDRNE